MNKTNKTIIHCAKSVRIPSFSGSFGVNKENYFVPLHIQFNCRKIQTRKSANKSTFHAVILSRVGFRTVSNV